MKGQGSYGESLGVDAVLNHGDADGEGAAVELAVLSQALVACILKGNGKVLTDENGGDLVQDIDGLLGRGLLLLAFVSGRRHAGSSLLVRLSVVFGVASVEPQDVRLHECRAKRRGKSLR
jgi:hypothetical protein